MNQHSLKLKVFVVLVGLAGGLLFNAPAASDPLWHKRCHGTGYLPCHVCHGEAGKTGHLHCPECRDSGKVKCLRCRGTGILFSYIQIQSV